MITIPATMDVPLWKHENGTIRVSGSRVLLELVIHAFNQGETPEGIIDSYPTLNLANVYAVIAYYLKHQAEVDAYVQQQDEAVERTLQDLEAHASPETLALRARLRAKLEEKQPLKS